MIPGITIGLSGIASGAVLWTSNRRQAENEWCEIFIFNAEVSMWNFSNAQQDPVVSGY